MYTLKMKIKRIFQKTNHLEKIPTLFAQKSPQALQSDLGPFGPRRIIGVDFELMPQCVHLYKWEIKRDGKTPSCTPPSQGKGATSCMELLSTRYKSQIIIQYKKILNNLKLE